jgi:hypothetical protein
VRLPPGLSACFCVFGVCWAVYSAWMVAREVDFEKKSRLLDAVVVGFVQRPGVHQSAVAAPVFRINVEGSNTVDVPSSLGSRPRATTYVGFAGS